MLILSIVLPLVLLLAVIVCVASARGSWHRSRWLGIRTPLLLASDDAWVAGHRAAILPSIVGFVVSVAVALAGLLGPSPWVVPAKFILVAVFISTVVAMFVVAQRAARTKVGSAA
jgi:hypothetical protein